MAAGLYPLRLAQIGLESTPGDPVAASVKLVGECVYTPELEREFEEFPRGVRAPVTGGGFVTQAGSKFEYDGNLTYEEATYVGLLGFANDAAPSGAGPYTWDFTPVLDGQTTVKTATIEFVVDDGSTLQHEREAAYCFMTEFEVSAEAGNNPAKLKFTLEGRADGTSTVTGSLAPITGRTPVPASLFGLWIDASGGTIGTTAKTQTLRSFSLKGKTGLMRDFTLDARTPLDLTGINSGTLTADFEMVLEHNANAATEIAAWRSGSVRLVRLLANNGAAAGANKQVGFDMAIKYTESPKFTQEDGIEIVTMAAQIEYDSGGALALIPTLINGLAAQP